ncbi:hypothetical protein [Microbacterium sp. PMB16]|uniref:hypothetical protein n=1 Tax=Microbacterium sp. PMB16 TaxID=3120157 RepID=UPI003F4B24FE
MGLFQHRKDEEENQWTLPSEPLVREGADVLEEAPVVDPMALGLGVDVSSIVFPVAPPPPAAVSIENHEPHDDEG